jgi:hypothetical protein
MLFLKLNGQNEEENKFVLGMWPIVDGRAFLGMEKLAKLLPKYSPN